MVWLEAPEARRWPTSQYSHPFVVRTLPGRSVSAVSNGSSIINSSSSVSQVVSDCVASAGRPPMVRAGRCTCELLLVCVQVLHEKPTLAAHWLACAGSVIQ